MRLLTNIFHKLVLLATAVIAILALCLVVPPYFGYTPFIVQSGSMEPAIETGSIVFTNTKDTDVAVGDIVTYRIGVGTDMENRVTHRIVALNETGTFTTQGDANDNPDLHEVAQEDIIGTYAFAIPKAGFFLAKFQEKNMKFIAFIWVAALNIISAYVASVFDTGEEEEEEEKEKK